MTGPPVPKTTTVKAARSPLTSSLAWVTYQITSCCLHCHILGQHGEDVSVCLIPCRVGGCGLFERHIYARLAMAQYWIWLQQRSYRELVAYDLDFRRFSRVRADREWFIGIIDDVSEFYVIMFERPHESLNVHVDSILRGNRGKVLLQCIM